MCEKKLSSICFFFAIHVRDLPTVSFEIWQCLLKTWKVSGEIYDEKVVAIGVVIMKEEFTYYFKEKGITIKNKQNGQWSRKKCL